MQGPAARSVLVGVAVWLLVSVVAGWAAVGWAGSKGSVLHFLTGAVVGAFGAVAHVVVCLTSRFRALGFVRRGLVTWLLAYVPFVALALVLLDPANSAYRDPGFWPTARRILFDYTGLPMLLLAVLVALVTSTPGRRPEPETHALSDNASGRMKD